MKFISYKCEFVGKINEIHILINKKSNREIPGFFKYPRIHPGNETLHHSQTRNKTQTNPGEKTANLRIYSWGQSPQSLTNTLPIGFMCRQSVLPAGNKRSNWKRITDQTMLYWENYNSFHFSFRFWSKWSSIWFKMGRKTVTTMVLLSQLALCVGKVSCQLETQQQSNASALRKLYFQQLVLLAMFWIESGTISIYDSYYLYFVSLWISITLLYYLWAQYRL